MNICLQREKARIKKKELQLKNAILGIEEKEELYIDTAEAEHVEMYLKAIWAISERKED